MLSKNPDGILASDPPGNPVLEKSTRRSGRACVLIVDDSPTALGVLQAVFEGEHYDVVTASDGMEGFEKAQRIEPDVLVTDGIMPGVDGFELLRMLKENPATRRIPVIMLTSGDIRDAEFQNRQPQPDAYVAKSMQMEPLLNRVKDMLATSL